jgi:putative ABC transport system substrate-binding protein
MNSWPGSQEAAYQHDAVIASRALSPVGPVTTRRTFLGTLAGGLLAAPFPADAQPAGKASRIGYLAGGSATASSRFPEAFRQGLRELGWVEGQNIVIEYRFAEGKFDRLPDLAAELVRLKVDVIVAAPAPSAVAAKNATTSVPIVMAGVGFPVELGLIASLARPGGNITGVSFSVGPEIFGKGLDLLKEAVPKVQRVAVLSNPGNPGHAVAIRNVNDAARALGVQLLLLEAPGPGELNSAFAAMLKERVVALLVVTDPVFIAHRAQLADLAARNRRPAMYTIRDFVDAGGLMSYGPSLVAQYRRAAVFVDKILKGAKPADLPVEQPTTFELVINLKAAKALGLTIPQSLLGRADEVIQ